MFLSLCFITAYNVSLSPLSAKQNLIHTFLFYHHRFICRQEWFSALHLDYFIRLKIASP